MTLITRGVTKKDAVESVNVFLCEGIPSSRTKNRKFTEYAESSSATCLFSACYYDNDFRAKVNGFMTRRNDLLFKINHSLK